jgi:hypothetical protein
MTIVVTSQNIDDVRDSVVALDQRAEIVPGCETWPILYGRFGGQRGQMTVWPAEGRGAVCWGADSQWGDWDAKRRLLNLDDGGVVDDNGEVIGEDDF